MGGDCANGIPRYLFTVAVGDDGCVVVPTMVPLAMIAVGYAPSTEQLGYATMSGTTRLRANKENIGKTMISKGSFQMEYKKSTDW